MPAVAWCTAWGHGTDYKDLAGSPGPSPADCQAGNSGWPCLPVQARERVSKVRFDPFTGEVRQAQSVHKELCTWLAAEALVL